MSSDQELEIVRIGKRLEKLANGPSPDEETAMDLLHALQGLPMTLDVLQKSHIGISVNKLRQRHSGTELASLAKKLIKSWKKLLPSKEGSKPVQSHSNHTHNNSSPSPQAPPTSSSRQSPPPVIYEANSPKNSTDSLNSNTTSMTSHNEVATSPGAASSRSGSFSSDTFYFSPSVSGEARLPATENLVRDRCRELLCKAMMKGFEKVTIEEEIKFFNLSAGIEDCIFSEYKDTGNKYKQCVRSRVANLGDLKNPNLRHNVISGTISPSRIATMTTDEMASDSMKKLRQQFTKEAIRDSQMAVQGGTHTDLLKCSKCKKRNCTYTQAQTRSADEPMTTFALCLDCGNRWKFC